MNCSNGFGDPQNSLHAQKCLLSSSHSESTASLEKHVPFPGFSKLEQRNEYQKRYGSWQYQEPHVENDADFVEEEMKMKCQGQRYRGNKQRAGEDAAMGVGCVAAVFVCGCVIM